MILRFLLLSAIASTTLSSVWAVRINHDKVRPFPQPAPVTESEKAAVKFQPSLIIDDACHPYPAVNAAGETSGGLKGTGGPRGSCKGSGLGSQVYDRAVWHQDLWAIMYAWYMYFPKDVYNGALYRKGHRHSWVSAVVWLDDPALEKPKILAVSTSLLDGYYYIKKNGPQQCGRRSCSPPFTEYINRTNPMLAYGVFKLGGSSLGMTTERFAETQDIVVWEQLTEAARGALSDTNFGKKVKVPFIDANLKTNLEAARPFL